MAKNTLKILGSTSLAQNSGRVDNPNDYYGTDPKSTKALLENEIFEGPIWEPCAGHHLIVNELEKVGYTVRASDIANYNGYPHEILDFFEFNGTWAGNIVTNPPYNLSTDFAIKALEVLQPGKKLAMFLRLQWLEGTGRYEKIFKTNPPKTVYIFSNRQASNKDDDFTVGSAVAYMWLIWEKGFTGNPQIKWINTNKTDQEINEVNLWE